MSLFGSLQLAKNSLLVTQLGIQVAGNNIANASTPGYIRQDINLTPAGAQKKGDLLLGLGVRVEGIVQKVDKFLEERLRGANSDLAKGETEEGVYLELEALIGELGDTDISTSLTDFFATINEILNQPENQSVRNLAVLQGQTLSADITRLDDQVRSLRANLNDRVIASADKINQLTSEIARLNVQIVAQEGGGTRKSDAVGLRDARKIALAELSKVIDIRTIEQPSSSVTVFSGGTYLVFEGSSRTMTTKSTTDRSLTLAEVRIEETDSAIQTSSGELAGLVSARDDVLGGFIDSLSEFTETFIFEFNKSYSSGQGLIGYDSLVGDYAVDDTTAALDQAGLTFTPTNGSFEVLVHNRQTGLNDTTDILVNLDGIDDDTSLDDLVAAIDAIDGISASITPSREVEIESDSANLSFSFANDTSGVLAALGLNTFFTGTSSSDVGVNNIVKDDPSTFAASRSGVGLDVDNVVLLADLYNAPLESQNGQTLAVLYDRFVSKTVQGSAVTRSVAEGFRVFQATLEGEHLGVSGVSIDEEAVRMLSYQRAFQASARYIQTVSELLDIMVNL